MVGDRKAFKPEATLNRPSLLSQHTQPWATDEHSLQWMHLEKKESCVWKLEKSVITTDHSHWFCQSHTVYLWQPSVRQQAGLCNGWRLRLRFWIFIVRILETLMLNICVNKIINWLNSQRLHENISKINLIFFSPRSHCASLLCFHSYDSSDPETADSLHTHTQNSAVRHKCGFRDKSCRQGSLESHWHHCRWQMEEKGHLAKETYLISLAARWEWIISTLGNSK